MQSGLIAGLVSAFAVILVGYQMRRQIRQVELFRMNPSVGIKPPPTWFARYGWVVILSAAAILNLYMFVVAGDKPITRTEVFSLAFSVASLVLSVALVIIMRVTDAVMEVFNVVKSLIDSMKALTTTVGK